MPNVFGPLGLEVKTRQEIVDDLTTAFQSIYGADINLASDTPDGQMLQIVAQFMVDQSDLLVAINASFDPDQAFGVILDQRVAINGIQRQGGTYTTTNITLVNSRSINLFGLDQVDDEDAEDVYTIADNAGNRWFLMVSELGLTAGSHVLIFRSELPGAQLTTPNTIIVPVTVVLGVTSVNNPTSYLSLGVNEETDPVLKLRRMRSVSLGSQGYRQALKAALQNLEGITSAEVYENNSDSTDSDDIPSHSIWVIVAGSALPEDIGTTIWLYRNAGCGMKGEETYTVTEAGGGPAIMKWDDVVNQNVFILLSLNSLDPDVPPDVNKIRTELPLLLVPGVNENMNTTYLGTLVQQIDPNTYVLTAGFSDGTSQVIRSDDTPVSGNYRLNYGAQQTPNIAWDANAAAVQTQLRLLTGLENIIATTGFLSGEVLFLNLSDVPSIDFLIFVSNSTMVNGGSAPLLFFYDEQQTQNIATLSKQNQFTILEQNILITQILLLPVTTSLESAEQITFVAYGGYGSYTYSVSNNNSGSSINATTGVYTAGPTDGTTDTIQVVDVLGNVQTSTVSVT